VLADHLLYRECVTGAGVATGYADAVFTAFQRKFGGAVLQNLAELDWRIRAVAAAAKPASRAIKRGPPVLDRIWATLHARFESAPHSERAHMLETFRDVAYLQPEPVLAIVEHALAHQATTPERAVATLFVDWDHGHVLRYVPPVLRQIAYHLEHLPRCYELLWELGRDDDGDVNGDHPINVMRDVASYDIDKPIEFAEAVMGVVERLAAASDAFNHRHTPLDALDPLMAKGGAAFRSTRRGISHTPFLVDPERVAAVQQRGLAVLAAIVAHPDFPAVKRAIDSLDQVLAAPRAPRIEKPTRAQLEQWRAMRSAALAILRQAAMTPHPLSTFVVREALARHARYGLDDDGIRADVRTALGEIEETYELRLARAVCESASAYDDEERGTDGVDWRAVERRQAEARQQVAGEFLARHKAPADAARSLEEFVTAARDAKVELKTFAFWEALTEASPAISAKVTARTATGLHPGLVHALDAGLRSTAEAKGVGAGEGVKLLASAARSKEAAVRRAAALSLRHRSWPKRPSTAEKRLFEALLHDPDLNVRHAAVGAVRWVAVAGFTDLALGLLNAVEFGGNGRIAAKVAQVFSDGPAPRGPLGLARVSNAQLRRFLKKLAEVDSIGDHELLELLDELAGRLPSEVIDLVLERLTIAEKRQRSRASHHKVLARSTLGRRARHGGTAGSRGATKDYRALPYQWHGSSLKKLTSAPAFPRLIRRLRDHALRPAGDSTALSRIFADATDRLAAPGAQEALMEWVVSGDHRKLEAATLLIQEAGRAFIFDNPAFVARVLLAARSAGRVTEQRVLSSLHISGNGGVIGSDSTSPGQPFPKDVDRRDRATALAATLAVGSPERSFYDAVARGAQERIDRAIQEGEEMDLA
jgi:hypothetical protein